MNVRHLNRAPHAADPRRRPLANFPVGTNEARSRQVPASVVDPVTGFPDRSGFIGQTRILQSLGFTATVIDLDIDRFTEINERFGIHAGDELLRNVAVRCARVGGGQAGQCVVGRVGADEFALALVPPAIYRESGALPIWVEKLLVQLQRELGLPFVIGGETIGITAVIGQAWLERGHDAAEVLQHAVAARHWGGCDRTIHRYEEQQGERRLTQALSDAIEQDRVEIALQPKVLLRSGRLTGFEALARWTLADGMRVPPSVFIALAERHGMISRLGERILARALGLLQKWTAQGLPIVPIAVNFSAMQFQDPGVVSLVASSLTHYGLTADRLELELTESKLLENAETSIPSLRALRNLGVHLSIDDFGTGYSSLGYLRSIPVHRLKIDRSFISGIVDDPGAREIAHLLVQLSHTLNLNCVAEGIESRGQLELLRDMGCDEGQGFFLAPPTTPETATRWLEHDRPWTTFFTTAGR